MQISYTTRYKSEILQTPRTPFHGNKTRLPCLRVADWGSHGNRNGGCSREAAAESSGEFSLASNVSALHPICLDRVWFCSSRVSWSESHVWVPAHVPGAGSVSSRSCAVPKQQFVRRELHQPRSALSAGCGLRLYGENVNFAYPSRTGGRCIPAQT